MSIPTIAFFNNKGSVGKTPLVYHVAHMAAEMGYRVLAADLDPQTNLTAACLADEELEELWDDLQGKGTTYGSLRPIVRGVGDVKTPIIRTLEANLALLPGNNSLSRFEDKLSEAWPNTTAQVWA